MQLLLKQINIVEFNVFIKHCYLKFTARAKQLIDNCYPDSARQQRLKGGMLTLNAVE